ncbi:MAG: GDYXXLXY domain-containing protein [Desulfobacterales bacterium]|nr:GDYXXLXY domain-containing protein [Desulfobacterales bacterium]
MRKTFILLAILSQFLVLAFMAGERETILRAGAIVHLRTAPIDPRDIFRGDYVRLNYEISRIALDKPAATKGLKELPKGTPLFVKLIEGPNGLFEPAGVSLEKPPDGLFIKGRSRYHHAAMRTGSPAWIDYGIEAYFVQQGKGKKIENRRGGRSQVQVPLEMEIAVSSGGKAVIKGYRWSPLGIGLQVLRRPAQNPRTADTPGSAAIRLTLANTSDAPLAIVDLPNACALNLEPVPWAKKHYTPAGNPCESLLPGDNHVIVLQSQQEKTMDIDLSDPRWLVNDDQTVKEIGRLEWSEQFRLVYRPPDQTACRYLENSEIIWHGYLPSRAFHGRGNID